MVGQGWTLGNASDQGPHAAPETLTTSTESAAATMNTTDVKEAETTGAISGQTADATNDRPSTSTKYLRYNLKWYNKSPLNKSVNASYHIWFLETSSRRKLKARQACSVESACRHNSDFTVHLLSNGNISSSDCPYHAALSKIPNFRSALLNASAILADTPLAPLQAKRGPLTGSRYPTEHLSDFLRLAMLWIHGGWKRLFDPKDAPDVLKTINGSYGVHFWNSISKGERVVPGSGCALDLLAGAHCPRVYRLALSDGDL
nr:uncharacterized protein LOC126518332 [Dermacentor andersoni]